MSTQSKRFRVAVPFAIAVALFMENLDSTVIATALPAIARSLDTTPLHLSMAVSVYLLSLAVFVPLSGWMADRFGTRTIFAAAIGIFTVGSALCGAAQSVAWLVGARALQGFGGAMMMPVGRLILGRTFAKRDLVTAMSYVTIPALIAPLVGPLVGGAIATYASWRWIFYVNLPIGLAGIAFALRVVENFTDPEPRPLDPLGIVLCGTGLAGIVLGFENVGRGVLPDGMESVLFAGAAGAFFLYWHHAKRSPAPALDLRLFRIATFRASVLGGTLSRIGFGATPFLLPLYFRVGFGMTPIQSGGLTFATAIGALTMKLTARPILRTLGFRRVLIFNATLVGGTVMAPALFSALTPAGTIISVLLFSGFLRSLQFTCMSALTFADLDTRQMSNGTSIASVAQQVAMSLGVAFGATVLHFAAAGMGTSVPTPPAFRVAFFAVGLMPIASVLVFARLPAQAGAELSGHASVEAEPQS